MGVFAMTGADMGQIAIERDRITVRISLTCKSEYDAMLIYDDLTKQMQDGGFKLAIDTRPLEEPKKA